MERERPTNTAQQSAHRPVGLLPDLIFDHESITGDNTCEDAICADNQAERKRSTCAAQQHALTPADGDDQVWSEQTILLTEKENNINEIVDTCSLSISLIRKNSILDTCVFSCKRGIK